MFIFFFQAEDGIRDAQESRGLGDVYKRQALFLSRQSYDVPGITVDLDLYDKLRSVGLSRGRAVSYTHLTLPTNREV